VKSNKGFLLGLFLIVINFFFVSLPEPGDCRLARSQCCSDCDCRGDLKCCFNGCGSRCVKPQVKLLYWEVSRIKLLYE
uniref:WAP domain-containing protein n=1 Tax=Neogobius melanostomus TaxID=47308 RepID=A0A8C6SAT5_9GOBI